MTREDTQRRAAISHAGTVVYDHVNIDRSLGIDTSYEESAISYIASADPHSIKGLFDWSFGYEDVPAIADSARRLEARVDG